MIETEAVALTYNKILQSKSYTAFVLGNDTKKFAIYTAAHVGENIQLFLSKKQSTRPSTHEFLQNVVKGCDARVMQVVIYDVEDTIYYSKLFLEMGEEDNKKIIEIEGRPSDCLILAMMNQAPIYCTKHVFEKAMSVEDPQNSDDGLESLQ